jgi:limonene-1,2-epoxide hydrolase
LPTELNDAPEAAVAIRPNFRSHRRDISRVALRPRLALPLLAAALLAGCGSSSPSAESVVRAWSHALNAGDNEGAAALFARNAEVVQPGTVLRLKTRAQAIAWNAQLPCSGRLVSISGDRNVARAVFVLGDRPTSKCDGPGQRATTIVRVRKGKIVLWHQTDESAPAGPAV